MNRDVVAPQNAKSEKKMDRAAYRLPGHVQPRHYTIALDARLDRPEYHGQVTVVVEILEPPLDGAARVVFVPLAKLRVVDARS